MPERPVISTRKLRKTFGRLVALNDVDFSVQGREIHGLLGENGAGKSTLMNILYGLYQPTKGDLFINEKAVRFDRPSDSIKHGIGMVHQYSTLVPSFTATENTILGTADRSFDLAEASKRIQSLADGYGFDFPMDVRVGELSVGVRQKIEIVRALYKKARILILDEPTTSLTQTEFEQLKDSLKALVAGGITCIFITHKIREVLETCDRVTVLRKGNLEGVASIGEANKEQLVKLMFSDQNIQVTDSALPDVRTSRMDRSEAPICEMTDVVIEGKGRSPGLRGVCLRIYGGEILGIAGVTGNGQKELAEGIINPSSLVGGDILLNGKSIKNLSTVEVFQQRVAYIPEDRMKEAILPEGSLTKNLFLSLFSDRQFRKKGVFVDWAKTAQRTRDVISEFKIHAPSEKTEIRRLSGGNIQKAVLGRALINPIDLLVAHNPCSGLDVSTVELILKKLVDLRNRGKAVLWINEDLEELMLCSDRIGVVYDGRICGVFARKEFDKIRIASLMTGVS
jgi:simple sugar transport system ATP-binding protein